MVNKAVVFSEILKIVVNNIYTGSFVHFSVSSTLLTVRRLNTVRSQVGALTQDFLALGTFGRQVFPVYEK